MNRSQRGSARVSILWFVGAIVFFIIALVMAFTAYSQKAAEHLLAQDATKRAADDAEAAARGRQEGARRALALRRLL
jgi:type II secretory pathway component PulK